jgi:hypothetical protein
VAATGRYDLRERRIEGVDLEMATAAGAAGRRVAATGHTLGGDQLGGGALFQVYGPAEGGIVVAEP